MTEKSLQNVSRETNDKLEQFASLVEKWTTKINLISKASVPHIWDRHIVDSQQIYAHAPAADHWADLGSGGGFPAIVLAVLSQGDGRSTTFTLVESDQRKCVFLRTAIRELSLDARVINGRIEEIAPLNADVLTARALAELSVLLRFADRHLKPDGTALGPKGEKWHAEDIDAKQAWRYTCDPIPSITNPSAAILKIKEVSNV